MNYKYVCNNIDDTITLAQNIESEKFRGMVICLDGDLGSGKTLFTKAFAKALGVTDDVTSPTYTIVKEYLGELPLYHMDVYRLDGNIDGIGFFDYFNNDGIVIIEWANTIKKYLPKKRLDIKIKVVNEDKRVFLFEAHGTEYEDVCEMIL